MSIRIISYSLDAISWVPLLPPVGINNRVEIRNETSVILKLRSSTGDPTSEIQILPGDGKVWEVIRNANLFDPLEPILYGMLTSSTGTVKVIAS